MPLPKAISKMFTINMFLQDFLDVNLYSQKNVTNHQNCFKGDESMGSRKISLSTMKNLLQPSEIYRLNCLLTKSNQSCVFLFYYLQFQLHA